VHYPPKLLDLTPRTNEEWRRIYQEDQEAEDAFSAGVNERSPFLDLPLFDIVEDIPPDALHLLHIGVTKGILKAILRSNNRPLWKADMRNLARRTVNSIISNVRLKSDLIMM